MRVDTLRAILEGLPDDGNVLARDVDGGPPLSVVAAEEEHHDDGSGLFTLWLRVADDLI